jgi:hypothetical protein
MAHKLADANTLTSAEHAGDRAGPLRSFQPIRRLPVLLVCGSKHTCVTYVSVERHPLSSVEFDVKRKEGVFQMTRTRSALLGAAVATAALAGLTLSASAMIACSGNVCWHVKERYTYPPHAGVIVHEDNWKWGPSERYSWREHEGRGYWSGEKWTDF